MGSKLKLPVGIDNFEKIRKSGFYYIDKTKLIEQLLQNWGEVSLFTRPRRFGKTLNMSMFKSFFEIGTDKSIFDGLYIAENTELCDKYMGKYPVIYLSLKSVDGLTFETAKNKLKQLIGSEAERFHFLVNSDKLSENEKLKYTSMIELDGASYTMTDVELEFSLQILSQLLCKHLDKKQLFL